MAKSNFNAFWTSISREFESIGARFQDIIAGKHNLSEGTYRELILRNAIRRHLPESLDVCTGFICTDTACSTQIDLLIVDKQGFTLFREGDLRIVTPSAVRAIVEVKTKTIGPKQLATDFTKLAKNASIVAQAATTHVKPFWAGLFSYRGGTKRSSQVLETLALADQEGGYPIDCVAFGSDTLIMKNHQEADGAYWLAFAGKHCAPAGFVTSLVANITEGLGIFDGRILFSPIFDDIVKPIHRIGRGQANAEPFPR